MKKYSLILFLSLFLLTFNSMACQVEENFVTKKDKKNFKLLNFVINTASLKKELCKVHKDVYKISLTKLVSDDTHNSKKLYFNLTAIIRGCQFIIKGKEKENGKLSFEDNYDEKCINISANNYSIVNKEKTSYYGVFNYYISCEGSNKIEVVTVNNSIYFYADTNGKKHTNFNLAAINSCKK